MSSSRQYALFDTFLGEPGYQAVAADYDGDGLADPDIYAPSIAYWQVLPSTSLSAPLAEQGRYTNLWYGVYGGLNGIPVPANYDGDGN